MGLLSFLPCNRIYVVIVILFVHPACQAGSLLVWRDESSHTEQQEFRLYPGSGSLVLISHLMQGLKQKKSTINKSPQWNYCLSAGWVSKQFDTT